MAQVQVPPKTLLYIHRPAKDLRASDQVRHAPSICSRLSGSVTASLSLGKNVTAFRDLMMASRAEVQSDSFQDVGKVGGAAGGGEGGEAGGSSRPPIKKPAANAKPQVTTRIAQIAPSGSFWEPVSAL